MNAHSRRDILRGFTMAAGAAAVPNFAWAGEADPAWTLGFANAPAEGFGPETLRLVHGRAPAGLAGSLYRNGPAWFRYADSAVTHWFDGDGMVRRFQFSEGAAQHTARFVDTNKWRVEQRVGAAVMPGFGTPGRSDAPVRSADSTNAANTSVLPVNGQIWALWEAGSPYTMNADTLATEGERALREDLAHLPFLAHPKVEPSGRIWNLGVQGAQCIVWRLSALGEVEHVELIRLPRPDYIHDWAMTERHLLVLLQPWTLGGNRPPFVDSLQWRGDDAFMILVIDKADLSNRRVFEAPAMSFFHTGDAYEEPDGTIRVDLCASADPFWTITAARDMLRRIHTPQPSAPRLVGLSLRPNGTVDILETAVTGEFPQTDRRLQGQRRALTALVADPAAGRPGETALAVWDWERGGVERFDFGNDHIVEEALFVPYGPQERDSWLIATSLNLAARATEVHVLDARAIAAGPVATWRSAYAAPLGFHGCYVSE
jgi:carotenoid cleavage dioxygenase-like enzyme